MNPEFQRLLDAHPRWSKSVRDAMTRLGEEEQRTASSVEYLPLPDLEGDGAAPTAVEQTPPAVMPAAPERESVAPEPWITMSELSALIGKSTRTIGRWMNEGMPYGGIRGGTVRFKLSECEAWLSGRRGGAEAQPDPEQVQLRIERLRGEPSRAQAASEAPHTHANASSLRNAAEQPLRRGEEAPEAAFRATAAAAEPWVDDAAIAAHLACKVGHIHELARRTDHRRIPHRKEGRRLLFKLSRVDAWLDRTGAR